jgi:hypothetical protein
MQTSIETRRLPVALVAIACLAPASIFLVAAIGRLLQPVVFEPAATFQAIFDWFAGLGRGGDLLLLLILPAVGTVVGAGLVWTALRADGALRSDLAGLGAALVRVLRRPAFVLGVVAVAFGGCYLAIVAAHSVAG